jgi:hypothetical protein
MIVFLQNLCERKEGWFSRKRTNFNKKGSKVSYPIPGGNSQVLDDQEKVLRKNKSLDLRKITGSLPDV